MTWIWIILALVYVLSRIDLIPDVLGIWGWLDDILVLYLLYRYLRRARGRSAPAGSSRPNDSQNTDTADSQTRKSPKESHEILEVAPNASPEEIHRAFRRLAAQYHPDKVAHLGAEFGELAEARFKEIQQAYDHLMDKKNQR